MMSAKESSAWADTGPATRHAAARPNTCASCNIRDTGGRRVVPSLSILATTSTPTGVAVTTRS